MEKSIKNINGKVVKKIYPVLEKAKQDKNILAVALFGSAAKKEKYRDIDICLFLKNKMPNIQMSNIKLKYLKDLDRDLDIQIFQQLPLYIRIRILKEGKIFHCKNEDMLYEQAFQTIKEFNLYEKIYEMYLENLRNG